MSLKKGIQHGKEKRAQYRGSKAIDPTCRNHGGDHTSRENRLHSFVKRVLGMDNRRDDYERGR